MNLTDLIEALEVLNDCAEGEVLFTVRHTDDGEMCMEVELENEDDDWDFDDDESELLSKHGWQDAEDKWVKWL